MKAKIVYSINFAIFVSYIKAKYKMKQNYLSKWNEETGKLANLKKRGGSLKPELLHKYNITYDLIAKWFGYSSAKSFNSSSIKEQMLKGVEEVIKHVQSVQ